MGRLNPLSARRSYTKRPKCAHPGCKLVARCKGMCIRHDARRRSEAARRKSGAKPATELGPKPRRGEVWMPRELYAQVMRSAGRGRFSDWMREAAAERLRNDANTRAALS